MFRVNDNDGPFFVGNALNVSVAGDHSLGNLDNLSVRQVTAGKNTGTVIFKQITKTAQQIISSNRDIVGISNIECTLTVMLGQFVIEQNIEVF